MVESHALTGNTLAVTVPRIGAVVNSDWSTTGQASIWCCQVLVMRLWCCFMKGVWDLARSVDYGEVDYDGQKTVLQKPVNGLKNEVYYYHTCIELGGGGGRVITRVGCGRGLS